jgi:dTDP-4-dehydrorhamnose 3,5-epimerase
MGTMPEDARARMVDAGPGRRDPQTVDPDGNPVAPGLAGVLTRRLRTQADERGEVTELLSAAWPESADGPPPHVYLATLEPGIVKGWIVHQLQSDRTVTISGRIRWVLYDGRPDSPTRGRLQIVTVTERNRMLLVVPSGVWHAAENVGDATASFLNMPTRAYDHAHPDKFRLPLDTAEIPFRFSSAPRPRG